nr:hypothetical protein [Maliibacterium massiliense]
MDGYTIASEVVVCVTDQFCCDRLIHAGRQLADETGRHLNVLSIQGHACFQARCAEALEYLFEVSKQAGAEMFVYYRADRLETAVQFMRAHNVGAIVCGMPQDAGPDGFVPHMRAAFAQADIIIVDAQGHLSPLETAHLQAAAEI